MGSAPTTGAAGSTTTGLTSSSSGSPLRRRGILLRLHAPDAQLVGLIHTRLDTAHIRVPPIDAPVSVEGGSVASLRFTSAAPAWSGTRFGLEQVFDEGTTTVRWIVVASTGALREAPLPELPDGLTLSDLGFRDAPGLRAFVEIFHETAPDGAVRDLPAPPWIEGVGAVEGDARAPRLVRDVSF